MAPTALSAVVCFTLYPLSIRKHQECPWGYLGQRWGCGETMKCGQHFSGVNHGTSQKTFPWYQADCCLVLYLNAWGYWCVAQHMHCLWNLPSGKGSTLEGPCLDSQHRKTGWGASEGGKEMRTTRRLRRWQSSPHTDPSEDHLLLSLHFAFGIDNVPSVRDTIWSGLHLRSSTFLTSHLMTSSYLQIDAPMTLHRTTLLIFLLLVSDLRSTPSRTPTPNSLGPSYQLPCLCWCYILCL